MITYTAELARGIGSLKTYVVVGYEADLVKASLDKDVSIVLQKKLLGTADAIRNAAKHFSGKTGDVLVLCGDTPLLTKETLKNLIKVHQATKAVCTVLTADVANPEGYGRIIRQADEVVAIREEKDAAFEEKQIKEINTGVYCFQIKELFKVLKDVKLNARKKEFYLTDIVALFCSRGLLVESVKTTDAAEALGINTREDLGVAESVVRQRILKKLMLEGVTIVDPSTTHIDSNVKIAADTVIHPFTVIGADVRIGTNCSIGPFCRIRCGVTLGNYVEVGNFTEISRSKVGDHTFMKHFSFIGDAQIGKRVNIGAGTITANFNGKAKNITRVEDDCFIGSDSVLIAPLTLGKRVVTAAGSVVTKGKKIPDGSVVMGVPAKVVSKKI